MMSKHQYPLSQAEVQMCRYAVLASWNNLLTCQSE